MVLPFWLKNKDLARTEEKLKELGCVVEEK